MTSGNTYYLSPKLEARSHPAKGHYGVFASQAIEAGELLTVWGGQIVFLDELKRLPEDIQRYAIQVETDLFLAPVGAPEPGDYFNHACTPNAGLSGQIALTAMRRIEPGEEVCFDYAMSESTHYDDFDCACGSPDCRGRFTGDDWQRPELQQRYAGYFSPYLQRAIDRQKGGQG